MKKYCVNNSQFIIIDQFQNSWHYDNAKNRWIDTGKAYYAEKWATDFDVPKLSDDTYIPGFREFRGEMGEVRVIVSVFRDWDNSYTYDVELMPKQEGTQGAVHVYELRAEDTIKPDYIADLVLDTYKSLYTTIPSGEVSSDYYNRLKKEFIDSFDFD